MCKSYTTRAQHSFPSEIFDRTIVEQLISIGGEVSAATQKERRVGWLDLMPVKFSAKVNGFNSLVLTKIDVLAGLPSVRVETDCL